MKISPQKLKDLTHRLSEKGSKSIFEMRKKVSSDPKVIAECKKAVAITNKLPLEMKRIIFQYDGIPTVSVLAERIAKKKISKPVRWINHLRAEVLEIAMNSKDEKEFIEKYNKINPIVK